ncbi:Beta-xylosidase [bacterium HR11]|nr:Beta-xylosidase [bacterium HR11]
MRRSAPIAWLFLGVAALTHPTPPSSPDAARDHVGFLGDYRLPHVQCAFRRLGLRWARVDFRWDQIQPARDVFDWSGPDSLVRTARVLGLRLMVNLVGTPAWANGGQTPNVPPRDVRDWEDFVRAVVARYARFEGSDYGVHHWLIWNEPNLHKFFTGTEDEYLDRILIPAARLIHALDPTAQVGAPEMTHHWLRQLPRWNLLYVVHRALPYIDIITHHTLARPDEIAQVVDGIVGPTARGLGRPLWLTEVGWDTCDSPCGLDWQAHAYRWTLEYRQARSDWLPMVVFYVMWTGLPCHHDVLMPDFTCENGRVRPAFGTVLDFLEGRPFRDPFPACHESSGLCDVGPRTPPRSLPPECRPRGP